MDLSVQNLMSPVRVVSMKTIDMDTLNDVLLFTAKKPVERICVISDPYQVPAREKLIEKLRSKYELTVLTRVQPDPLTEDIISMLPECGNPDIFIGIGGGSVLDSAKAVSMLYGNTLNPDEFFSGKAGSSASARKFPLVLIPTTAGTGSEVTRVGVYRDTGNRKHTVGSPPLFADTAVLIGELTAGMPPALCAATGFDALSHALESVWNKNATPATLRASARAARAVLENFEPLYDALTGTINLDSSALYDRALSMTEAACMAGMAFSITGTAMGHAISFILGEEWHVPHGKACAFTLEDCFTYVSQYEAVKERLIALAEYIFPVTKGESALAMLYDTIVRTKKKMNLPFTFKDMNITITRNEIEKLFARSFDDPKMKNTLPLPDEKTVYDLLEKKIC